MRSIALQAILRAPGYYLLGTADMFVQTFAGQRVRLRQDWMPWRGIVWDKRVSHLLPAPTAAEDRNFVQAESIATLYDPARFGVPLAILMLVGMVAGPGCSQERGRGAGTRGIRLREAGPRPASAAATRQAAVEAGRWQQ